MRAQPHWRLALLLAAGLAAVASAPVAAHGEASLWVPPKMIKGQAYEGLLVLDDPAGGALALSSSDPAIVSVDSGVVVPAGSNHGIFEVRANKEGHAAVYAGIGGLLVEARAQVYAANGRPQLMKIVLPSDHTRAERAAGFVILVDAGGSPAPAERETSVALSSSSMISVPEEITVHEGRHYAKFSADIRGSGQIFASAAGLDPAEAEITRTQDPTVIRMAAGPPVSMENSRVSVHVWLEKGGLPFKPPYIIDARLTSSDTQVVRMRDSVGHSSEDIASFTLYEGVGYAQASTVGAGTSVLTASIDGFGSAQTAVTVGPAEIDPDSGDVIGPAPAVGQPEPNVAMVWAYPPITDGPASGVIALYHAEPDPGTGEGGAGGLGGITRLTPVPLDGSIVSLSSAGLDHPETVRMTPSIKGGRLLHAVEFDMRAKSAGEYSLFASGPDLARSHAAVGAAPRHEESYHLRISPIPVLPGVRQPLALVSIHDAQGSLTDVSRAVGRGAAVSATLAGSEGVPQQLIISEDNTAVIWGSIGELTRASASFASLPIAPFALDLEPALVASSSRLEAPARAHATEGVPFVLHAVDAFGAPVSRIEPSAISGKVEVRDGRLYSKSPRNASIAVLSGLGAAESFIEFFANPSQLRISPPAATARLGQGIEVTIDSGTAGMDIRADSQLPVAKSGPSRFVITPDREGIYDVVFTGSRDGYAPASAAVKVTVQNAVSLRVQSFGSDGAILSMPAELVRGEDARQISVPYEMTLPPGPAELRLPADHDYAGKSYSLAGARAGDTRLQVSSGSIPLSLAADTSVIAEYSRTMRIQVDGASGSGYYPYGHTVVIEAPPRDKHLFLVREVFDRWEGVPGQAGSSTAEFAAVSDVSGRAVYRDDYFGLMAAGAAAATAAAAAAFAVKRRIPTAGASAKRARAPNYDW